MLSTDALLQQLHWRYAVKKFDASRKIPAATWSSLVQATVLSPSSYGLQPWKFVVVDDPKLRETLKPASYNQPQITDASHLVVFCSRTNMDASDVQRLIDRMVAVQGVTADSLDAYKQTMLGSVSRKSQAENEAWAANQVFIALGFFLSAAAQLGIDACPMEGFERAKYDEILGLTAQGYGARVLATAGYRAADDKYGAAPKVRFEIGTVVEHR